MLKTLFATTAVASTLALGAAFAQQATDPLITPPVAEAPAEIAPTAPSVDTAQQPESAMPAQPETETAQDPLPMAPADSMAAEGPILTPVAPDQISADTLIGATIQTAAGESIASVQDVVMSADGTAEGVVAQFGGFLGFGSNTVLLSMDEFEVLQDEAGNFVVETALTPEALEGRPEYQAEN